MNQAAPLSEPTVPIYRLKAGEKRVFLCTSTELLGVCTHWLGRTRLCTTRGDCPACFSGMTQRWTGYLGVLDHRKIFGLLEIQASCSSQWEKASASSGLLNCVLEIGRTSLFAGIRLLNSKTCQQPTVRRHTASDLFLILARILGLPRPKPAEQPEQYERRVEDAAHAALRRDLGIATPGVARTAIVTDAAYVNESGRQ